MIWDAVSDQLHWRVTMGGPYEVLEHQLIHKDTMHAAQQAFTRSQVMDETACLMERSLKSRETKSVAAFGLSLWGSKASPGEVGEQGRMLVERAVPLFLLHTDVNTRAQLARPSCLTHERPLPGGSPAAPLHGEAEHIHSFHGPHPQTGGGLTALYSMVS